MDQIARVILKGNAGLSLAFVLWSANTGMKALVDALNVA